MVTRVCRHCGAITEHQTAAGVKGSIPCPECGRESVLLTEKQAEKLMDKERAKEEKDKVLIEQAKKIRDSFPNIPVMAYNDHLGFSPFLCAVSMGISFPPGCTKDHAEKLVQNAKDQGIKRNPYVFEEWTHEQCWDFWYSKIPAYPNLIGMLLKSNICSDEPITALDGDRIFKNLLRNIYHCPYCGHRDGRLGGAVGGECKKCRRIIKNCLYKVAYRLSRAESCVLLMAQHFSIYDTRIA